MGKFIFNFFYQKRYTMFDYLLLGIVIGFAIGSQWLIASILFVLGNFFSSVFQVLAEGAKKYGI